MSIQDRSDWLTVEAAAARIGVSPATIKRRIQDRKPVKLAAGGSVDLEVEMIERPQGHEWRVRIVGALPPISSDHERTDSEEQPAPSSVQARSEADSALLERMAAQDARLDAKDVEIARLNAQALVMAARAAAAEMRAEMERAARERAEAELERERKRSWLDRLLGR